MENNDLRRYRFVIKCKVGDLRDELVREWRGSEIMELAQQRWLTDDYVEKDSNDDAR